MSEYMREYQVRQVPKSLGGALYVTLHCLLSASSPRLLHDVFRCEMGPLSQLQVGEYIIKEGGSKGNFALHMDGASSEGRELSGFVLGHRPIVGEDEPSRINNLLLDIKWAMDKTAATRARDFQSILLSVAELCKKVPGHSVYVWM